MLTEILSDENIALHKEYVRQKRLKLSVIESYLPALSGVRAEDIYRLQLDKRDRDDVLALLPEITLTICIFHPSVSKICAPSLLPKGTAQRRLF